jgi:hypothetical protein
MFTSRKVLLSLVLCAGAIAGCASTKPVSYGGLTSATQLAANPQDKDEHVPFLYSAVDTEWRKYTSVILDPVVVYGGPDQQFGNTSEADKTELAAYMQTQFAQALRTRYAPVTAPGPTTLRIHVTLTGVETSTPVLSPLTKIAPINALINVVQTARDKQAFFTGSVSYAVEIYDGASNHLLRAYVTKQYPWAENVAVSFTALGASRSGVRNGAEALLAQLH